MDNAANMKRGIFMAKKAESGFSIIELLIILLVLAILGVAGFFAWRMNQDKSTRITHKAATSNEPVATDPTFNELPESWTEYRNDANGLRLGYPAIWGALDVTTLHTPTYTNADKNLDGRLTIGFSKKDGFNTVARKYGATIAPAADGKSWIVAEENPAAVDGYKVGDSYKTISKSVNGSNAIDLSFTDEECQQTHFVLELKQSYADISLPELCAFESLPITDENKAAYTKLVSDFLKTITVY